MTSLRKDDGTVAGAEAIVASIESKLAAARSELEATARARRPLAYAAALDDAVAARQLATLVKDETAAQTKVRNLELACEMAGAELVAAKEAEIRARRPRYVSDRTRRIGGLTIEPGVEFELLNSWPTEDDVPCNEAAESVVEYIKANSENPRLPSSPWNSVARCIALPPLPEFKPRPRWVDPRKPWNNSAAGLDSISTSHLPPDASPRRSGGSQRRV